MKKIISMLIVLMLVSSILIGCSGGKEKVDSVKDTEKSTIENTADENAGNSELPESLSLSILAPKFVSSPEGTLVHEEWERQSEEYLGVDLDLDHQWIAYQELKEKVKVVFASGDIPDVVMGFGEIERYAEEDLLLDLNKYDTPFYDEFLKKAYPFEKTVTHPGDAIYGFFDGAISDKEVTYANFPLYRFDLFKKHDLKVPETFDEFYDAAVKLKELYPDVYPVSGQGSGSDIMWIVGVVATMNHSARDFYWDGEEYKYALYDEGYKDAVEFLAKLHSDGLLDPEFIVNDKAQHQVNMTTNKTFMVLNSYAGRAVGYNNTDGFEGQWGYGIALASDKYGKGWNFYPRFGGGYKLNKDQGIGINKNVDFPELVAKLVDYQYSPEIIELLNWGIEGKTYVKKDNTYELMDVITQAEEPRKKMAEYGISTSMDVRSAIPFTVQLAESNRAVSNLGAELPEFYSNGEFMTIPVDEAHLVAESPTQPVAPMYRFTDDDREFRSQNYTPVKTYQKEQLALFITGQRDFAEWDRFIEESRDYGDIQGVCDIMNNSVKALYEN